MQYKLTLRGSIPPQALHSSGAETIKIFDTFEDANAMKDELNGITFDNVHWEVTPISAENNKNGSVNDTAKI